MMTEIELFDAGKKIENRKLKIVNSK